jgi:hypothetical protein
MPARVSRLAILTAWLHHARFAYGAGSRGWRDAATNPDWLAWTRHDLPCGAIVRRSAIRPIADPAALKRACEAPGTGNPRAKAGVRRFAWCIPFAEPEADAAARQGPAFETLRRG